MAASPALRVLSVNLCAVSPGGNLRCPVALGILGASLSILLIVAAAATDSLPAPHSVGCLAPGLYALFGVMKAKGVEPRLAGVFATLFASTFWAYPVWPLRLAWWSFFGFGTLALTSAYFAQLLNWGLLLFRPDLADNFVGPRLQLFLAHVRSSSYDVICVQEMTVAWGRDAFVRDVIEALREEYPYSCGTSRWPSFPATFAATGILVLSKFPIETHVPFAFRRQALFEFNLIARGGLMARIRHPKCPEMPIDFCTVHTTSGLEVLASEVGSEKTNSVEKFANPLGLEQLLEAVKRFETFSGHAPGPLRIFCGDFNLDALGGPMHQAALSRFRDCAQQKLALADAGPYSDRGAGPTFGCTLDDGSPAEWLMTKPNDLGCKKRLDFIYSNRAAVPDSAAVVTMRNDDQASRHLFQEASDHRGLALSLPLGAMIADSK